MTTTNESPKWSDFPRYPVVAGTILLAVGITLAWWAKVDISILFETAYIRRGQLWRLVTNIFPHLDILHLVFNVWWLWIFGTKVESALGHAKTALLVLLLAVGSGSFDFAFAHGGVGLSGVGYGFFGLLWVLSKNDARFQNALEPRTTSLFVGWFFLCIFTTVTGIYPVANVAHGAGAVFGAIVAYAVSAPRYRLFFITATGLLFAFGVVAATFLRPYVNLTHTEGYEEGRWGYDALLAKRDHEAIRWLRDAVRYQPKTHELWYDLGIAYQRVGDTTAAMKAYRKARELAPTDQQYADAMKALE